MTLLVTVKNSGGTTLESFSYDGLNRRVTNTVSGTTTTLFYSDQWQVLEEKVGSNTAKRYVWSPVYVDAMILRDRDTDGNGTLDERLWVQQDANWNVTALINGSGTVVERYAYDAYGVQTVYDATYGTTRGSSSYGITYGFQGMEFDSISGLDAASIRWYSPALERWITTDPLRFRAADTNLYRFVGNNPTKVTDPSGLETPSPSIIQQVQAAIIDGIVHDPSYPALYALLKLYSRALAWHFKGTLTVTITDTGNHGTLLPIRPLKGCRCALIGTKVVTYPIDTSINQRDSSFNPLGNLPVVKSIDETRRQLIQMSSLVGQTNQRIPRIVWSCWALQTSNLKGTLTLGGTIKVAKP